jgi:hypothetical protein
VELQYSAHVIEKLGERFITEDMVQSVLNAPLWMPAIGPNTCYDGIVNGRRLRVVVAEEYSIPILVTAHWIDRRAAQ